MSGKFNCVLIGHESVLIRCGQILLERGHDIRGMISAGTLVSEWAASQRIPIVRPYEDIKAFLNAQPFDYLFSLANQTILSKEILELPRKYAINCHNSLLPKYAGVHATAWSILHLETIHGITWHVMSEQVDAGDILRQVVINIDQDETAFTLDGKCYEAAVTSFRQVIDDLEHGQVAFKTQNQHERTYFSASTKPSAGCMLSWNRPAHELDAFVRALNFGTHPNPLGLPKLPLGSNYVIVSQVDVLDEPSTALPGTIVDIEPDGLKVATTSTNLVLRQLQALEGQCLSIPELIDQYELHVGYHLQDIDADTATRLNTLEAHLARHEAFWVKRLADLRPLALPYASRMASRRTPRVDCLPWRVPEEALVFLEDRPSSSWTYEHFQVATFVAFLSRISQSECFDLGFKPAGLRDTLTGVDALYASTVPLRIQVRDEHTLEDVLHTVTKQMALAKRHLTYPRDIVLRYAELRASAEGMNHEFPIVIESVDALKTFHPDTRHEHELTLVLADDTDACLWVYDAEKFDPDTMIRMQEQYSSFIQRMIATPNQAITTIPLLSDQDLHDTLVAWNDTQAEYPHDLCIHHMFEAQVEQTPNAVALSFDEEELTYSALNGRANQLAHHLQELGVGPDVLVGMCVERSIDMIIGLLGILKAGGAYVPLDPASPSARLKFMLEDSGAQVLLAQKSLVGRLPEHQARVLCIDAGLEEIRGKSQENPVGSVSSRNLCYVIYTSGSTGTPKGVLIEHRAVCNLASVLIPLFDVTADSRVLQFASFSFDTSVAEIFMALCAGARLCLARWSALLPGPELLQVLREQAITHAALPPSTLAVLPTEPLPALRSLIVAGEACSADLVAKWAPGRRFFNGYGPTETTVCATVGECTAQAGRPAIGRPIANTQAYILDRHLQPVPIGVLGELHVGGVNVARGYHQRPELTAAKFIANPFSPEPQARLYKTGDLARYLPDGTIEFVGRSDHQVKIRGFRIELEEIESVLKLHPEVEQVVVNVYENHLGSKSLVAYIVPAGDRQLVTSELRRFLLERLAEYMIPDRFITLKTMPQTPSGKPDRRALPAPDQQRPEYETYTPPHSEVERFLTSLWSDILGRESVSIHDNFFDQGGNSLLSLQTAERISQEFGMTIPVVTLYQYPTIHALAQYLAQHQAVSLSPQGVAESKTQPPAHQNRSYRSNDIAIIGMAGRFPGAVNVDELWRKLCDGVECISFFTDDELSPLIEPAIKQDKNYVKAKGVIEDADTFDAAFFGITPKEAEIMDPQQRLFLEVAHEALENAGHSPESFDGSIGVYGGSGFMSYLVNNINRCPEVSGQVSGLIKALSNDKDYMTTRVAYKLNLKGPCLNIGTACSTSLVAVVNAVNNLLNHQCDMAIAGGVTVDTPLKSGYVYEEEGMHSPDGHCRPFDAKAQGTVMSNGVAIVVLRRLEDALQDGDHIEAVIRGVGINNDGSHKVSFSAPSVGGQAAAIAMAYANADISPETLSYVEAHGTATPLGDPIEIAALTQAFRVHTSAKGFCAIGSIKGNVGHLDTAAGVTGLIKVALALKHQQIPPSLHFEEPNPQIDFANSPFYVNAVLSEWKVPAGPRRAGVSSFGMGGTNAHVVCEEAPELSPSGPSRPRQLLVLSAKTESALEAATTQMSQYFRRSPEASLADVCYTLAQGRTAFAYRRFVVCHDHTDAVSALESLPPQRTATRYVPPRTPEIVFMFPGQGSQYLNMGLNLYHHEDVFKNHVDLCAELMAPDLGCDLRRILLASDAHTAATIQHTGFTQPAMFTVEYALAKLWQSWGIHPRAMIGHSIGEFVAACLAGVFSLEDALRLVVRRGQLMEALPQGSMLSVRLGAAEVQKRLGSDVSIAAVNAPALCVVSGPTQAVEKLQHELEHDGVPCRLLHTSHAFHSAMVEPIVAPFTQHCTQIHLSPPRIDLISTVTGRWMTPEQAMDPAYWGTHLRAPVRFAEGIQALWQVPDRVLLEVGPGTAATIFARQQVTDINRQTAIPSLGTAATDEAESTALCLALGQLWLSGARPDWKRYYQAEQRHRLALPTYPFERKRFWLEPVVDTMMDEPERSLPAYQLTEEVSLPRSEVRHVSSTSAPMRVLKGILEQSTGLDLERIDEGTTFIEMGLDSLALTQIAQRLQKQFNLKITFRQLVEAYPNLNTLAVWLAQASQPEAFAATDGAPAVAPQRQIVSVGNPFAPVDDGKAPPTMPVAPAKPFGAAARIVRHQGEHLTPSQKAFVDRLIERYTRRTAKSKAYVQAHRLQFADPRTVSGFDPIIKEIVYPIVAARSSGTRIWDLDGNEYVDVVSGFGSSLFGYLPPFIKEAMQAQLERGMEVGPQTPLAGEVAELICELTHLDRATFCNTGSEAVLGAMRLARTVTGRSKIAMFSGSYHGIFDEVLVRGTKQLRPIPASPGVMQEAVDNILVVDYATPEALQILEARMGELAAILVEPVQSRRPELQPRTFLHLLRRLTERGGAALIVDEMITGFRIHQGGAQAHFGIRADLATYGKIVGGGMPIGVLAGTAKFMDAIDGGYWQFGDTSAPEVDITYFAGTFVRHPLTIAAAKAALEYLKEAGPALQRDLNAKSDAFVTELNSYFTTVRAPMHLVNCGSLLKLELQGTVPMGSLLYYVLRSKGIHIGEHRPFFFTTAHTADDLARIAAIFKESVWELQQAGFLLASDAGSAPEPSHGTHLSQVAPLPGARLGRDPQGAPGWYVPDDNRPGKYLKIEASAPSSATEPDMKNGGA